MATKTKNKARKFAEKHLRHVWLDWPERTAAIKAAKRPGGYECAICGLLYKRNEIEVNHIRPVMPITKSSITMDEFVERLLCDRTDLEILDKKCHLNNITKSQNYMRKFYKMENK